MKKLFYIVLVIVALMVISRFVKEKATPPRQPLPLRPKPQNPLPPLCRILTASATPNPPATRVMKTAIPMPPNRPATANSPTAKPLPSSRPLKRLRKSTPTKLPATMKPSLTTKQLPRRRHPLRPRLSRQQNNRVTLGKKMLSKSCSGEQLFYCFL